MLLKRIVRVSDGGGILEAQRKDVSRERGLRHEGHAQINQ